MNYDSISKYDVGTHPNFRFPQTKSLKCKVPFVSELIDSVENYTKVCPLVSLVT